MSSEKGSVLREEGRKATARQKSLGKGSNKRGKGAGGGEKKVKEAERTGEIGRKKERQKSRRIFCFAAFLGNFYDY